MAVKIFRKGQVKYHGNSTTSQHHSVCNSVFSAQIRSPLTQVKTTKIFFSKWNESQCSSRSISRLIEQCSRARRAAAALHRESQIRNWRSVSRCKGISAACCCPCTAAPTPRARLFVAAAVQLEVRVLRWEVCEMMCAVHGNDKH